MHVYAEASQRVKWMLKGRQKRKDFLTEPYWMLDIATKRDGVVEYSVAVVAGTQVEAQVPV